MNEAENNDIEQGNLLRDGSFGPLYKGRWNNKKEVVIKKFSLNKGTPNYSVKVRYFREEMVLHKELSHPNIVQLLKYQNDPIDISHCYIVLEFISSGDLFEFIGKNDNTFLEWRISVLEQVIQALDYLHNIKRIIHRDLKTENVLIKEDGTGIQAKLCDFRLAIKLPKNEDSFRDNYVVGTYQCLAPEIMASKEYSLQSDVYALGMIAYELLTKLTPFSELNINKEIVNAVKKGKRPIIPDTCPKQFSNFIVRCWQQEAKKRPVVKDLLTDNLFNLNKPDSNEKASEDTKSPLHKLSSSKDALNTTGTCHSNFQLNMWSKPAASESKQPAHRNFCTIS